MVGSIVHSTPSSAAERPDGGIVAGVLAHQHVRDQHVKPLRLQRPDRGDRAVERSRDLGDGVVDLGRCE